MRIVTAISVALLVVADCPHEAQAAALLRRALDDLGLAATTFDTRIIRDRSEAEQTDFVGSPTILINGTDPFRPPDAQPGLACRIYRSGTGTTAVPELGLLRQTLQRAADR
jgi:hypothetical protein